jgi:predicted nucleic acid-binding protein
VTGKASARERQYWDANVIIAVIGGEQAASICSQILIAAERGEVEIVTSTLTIAEVTGGRNAALDEDHQQQIDAFFQQPYVLLVSVDRTIAKRAQQLRIDRHRLGVRGLPGNDAIHLATALDSNVDIMFTLDDDDLLGLSEEYTTRNGQPLAITPPRWTYQSDFLSSKDEDSTPEGNADSEPSHH